MNNYSWIFTILILFLFFGFLLPYLFPILLVVLLVVFLRSLFKPHKNTYDYDDTNYQDTSNKSNSQPKNGAIDVEYTERDDDGEDKL